jgi:hypothetical protein
VHVFPVPTLEKLFIELPDNYDLKAEIRADVFDMMGNKVLTAREKTGLLMLSTESLMPGFYLIDVFSGSNKWTEKFIKK